MRISSPLSHFLGGAAAVMILVVCPATGMSRTLPRVGGGISPQSVLRTPPRGGVAPVVGFGRIGSCPKAPLGFISDSQNNVIYESNASGAVCGTLTGFATPLGLAVDKNGNVYVANAGDSDIVEVSSSTGALLQTFADFGAHPNDVAVDSQGNLAVANDSSSQHGGAGYILFYAAGSASATGSAVDPNFTSPRFCAFDKRGDLDFDDVTSTGSVNVGTVFRGNVDTFGATIHPLNGAVIESAGGVQVLNTPGAFGTLAILDSGTGSGGTIDTYRSLSYPNLGPATQTALAGSSYPVGLAFTPGGTYALTADIIISQARAYRFPSGSFLEGYSINGAYMYGAGISPTEQFPLH